MCSEIMFCIFIVVQPTSEPNISQQPTPDASQSIQAPELEEPVPLVPEVIEMPEAQPEKVLTASVALPSSVRNEGTSFCIKCY